MKRNLNWVAQMIILNALPFFQTLHQFTDQDPLRERENCILLTSMSIYCSELRSFSKVVVYWGKQNAQIYWVLLNTAFEVALIFEDTKYNCDLGIKVETGSVQMAKSWLKFESQ